MTNTAISILFVEDEISLAEIVRESLESRNFIVFHHATATAALAGYYSKKPDIILLDVMLPDADGFAFARQIRSIDMETPIIFLTSKSLSQDVVRGFENGGNDYLKKPFSLEELVVRIKALTNKNRTLFEAVADLDTQTAIGSRYVFRYWSGLLQDGNKRISLTSREAELLKLLLLNRNRVLERKVILLQIWNNDDFFSGRSLDVFISRLRKYFSGDEEIRIINIRGVGYKLVF